MEQLLVALVLHSEAFYEPAKQTRIVMLLWRTVDEWAEVLHSWVHLPPAFVLGALTPQLAGRFDGATQHNINILRGPVPGGCFRAE